MKTRTKRSAAAALAALALLAGYAITGSKAGAQAPTSNPLQGFTMEALNKVLLDYCWNAWGASSANATCLFRYGGIEAEYPDCVLTGVYCERSRGVWIHNTWRAPHQEIDDLTNCLGTLKLGPC